MRLLDVGVISAAQERGRCCLEALLDLIKPLPLPLCPGVMMMAIELGVVAASWSSGKEGNPDGRYGNWMSGRVDICSVVRPEGRALSSCLRVPSMAPSAPKEPSF